MILGIDPGCAESGYVIVGRSGGVDSFGKEKNEDLLEIIDHPPCGFISSAVIEMVGNYGSGMPAGKTVFETAVWIGIYMEALREHNVPVTLIKRKTVVNHLCGTTRAKDGNVRQALVDKHDPAHAGMNHGKGTKDDPGLFYGFAKDAWQAYALVDTFLDKGDDGTLEDVEIHISGR